MLKINLRNDMTSYLPPCITGQPNNCGIKAKCIFSHELCNSQVYLGCGTELKNQGNGGVYEL